MTTAAPGTRGPAPVVSRAMVAQYARELVHKSPRSRVLALKGDPSQNYPDRIEVPVAGADPVAVTVRACVSALAVRDALDRREPDEPMVIITDRSPRDLGDTILARFQRQRIELADTWHAVARLFAASRVDPQLRGTGPAVADALLQQAPAGDYPAAPAGVVTPAIALAALAGRILGLGEDDLTAAGLLRWTGDQVARQRWLDYDDQVRTAIREWAVRDLGPVAGIALDIGSSSVVVDATSLGLAADVLWPAAGEVPAAALQARVRFEQYLAGPPLSEFGARELADAARGTVLRLAAAPDAAAASGAGPGAGADTGERERVGLLNRSQQVLADVGWPEGADRSSVLPAGYDARLRALAEAISSGAQVGLESALVELSSHGSARLERDRDTEVARMAVRLARWLAVQDDQPPGRLDEALQRQMSIDSWVDRAVADVSVGSGDPQVAGVYAGLCQRALARRRNHDLRFAGLLAAATAREAAADGVLLIEDVLAGVVRPLAKQRPVLVIVVDGMSTAVAGELASEISGRGWDEVVPAESQGRLTALAVLPTMTTFSRTSLLCGELRAGTQADEKREFPRVAGGPAFHKDDLRTPAGYALAPAVAAAIAGRDPAVAVVLNTVDDTLAKHDPDGTTWTLERVQHLRPLLDEAAAAGRTVVLTSDHGHVVERGSAARPVPGAENRWRPSDGSPPADDEVLLTGRRVLAGRGPGDPVGSVIAPAVEDLRYARRSAGYHGGATPAEAAVPVLVFSPGGAETPPVGWLPAPPQAPAWWFEPVGSAAVTPGAVGVSGSGPRLLAEAAPKGAAPRKRGKLPPRQEESLFEIGEPDQPAVGGEPDSAGAPERPTTERLLAQQVLASPAYATQEQRAGRAVLDRGIVEEVLTLLLAGGGRADEEAVAAAAGVPASRVRGRLTVLRRLLNVERYEVIGSDPDGRTVVLDTALLRDQFLTPGTR